MNGTAFPVRTGDPQIHNLSPRTESEGFFCKPGAFGGLSHQGLTSALQTEFSSRAALKCETPTKLAGLIGADDCGLGQSSFRKATADRLRTEALMRRFGLPRGIATTVAGLAWGAVR